MRWDERMGRRLKLRDLHTLQAVVDSGSMARAAESLALSQPAISKAIAEMEHALGVPLLDRTPRGVEPTAYGRVLIERGVVIFDELRQGLKEIEFLADPAVGEVRIGSPEPMSVIVASAIDRLIRKHPRLLFHTFVNDTLSLYGLLRERRIDLAITRMADPAAEPDLEAEVLFDDALSVVAGERHPLLRRRRLALGDLVGEAWVLPAGDGFLGRMIVDAFRSRGLQPPRTAVTTASSQMWYHMLATGRFLGMIPSAVLRLPSRHAFLRPLPIALPDTTRPIGLVALKNRRISPAAHLFAETVRSVTKTLART